jgi:hypothetical protein
MRVFLPRIAEDFSFISTTTTLGDHPKAAIDDHLKTGHRK